MIMTSSNDYVLLDTNYSRKLFYSTSKIDSESKGVMSQNFQKSAFGDFGTDVQLDLLKANVEKEKEIQSAKPFGPDEDSCCKSWKDFSVGDFMENRVALSSLIQDSAKAFSGQDCVDNAKISDTCGSISYHESFTDYDVPVPHSLDSHKLVHNRINSNITTEIHDSSDYLYDVPPKMQEGHYDVPPNMNIADKYYEAPLESEALYDVPKVFPVQCTILPRSENLSPWKEKLSTKDVVDIDHLGRNGFCLYSGSNDLHSPKSDFDERWEKSFKDLGLSWSSGELLHSHSDSNQYPHSLRKQNFVGELQKMENPLFSSEKKISFQSKSVLGVGDIADRKCDAIKKEASSIENCVARALYDNVAESPDELAFCKGDLLTVLEQNTAGLEGWWLCSLRGRQGICPGNRLRIIPGCYDTGSGLTSTLSGVHPTGPVLQRGHSVPQQQRTPSKKVVTPKRVGDVFTYDVPRTHSQMDYDVPPSRHQLEGKSPEVSHQLSRSSSLRYDSPRPLMRSSLEQYDTPRRQECQYDSPSSRPLYDSPKVTQNTEPQSHYDIPRSNEPASSAAPRSLIKGIRGGQPPSSGCKTSQGNQNAPQLEYDVPRPLSSEGDQRPCDRSSNISLMSCDSQLSTSSSASSLQASESLSLSSIGGESNRSSLEAQEVYDIPPEPRRFVQSQQKPKLPPREGRDSNSSNVTYDTPNSNLTWSKSGEAVYDVPPQVSRDTRSSDTFDSILNRLSSGSDSSGVDIDLLNFKELPLELNSAVETLVKYEQDALVAVDKVAALKSLKVEANKIEDIKISIYRLKEAVGKLVNFGRGSVGNALRASEHKLAKRLTRLIDPIESASVLTCDSWKRLQNLPPGPAGKTIAQEQFVQVASITTSLAENIRYLSNVIQSNAHLCFKRAPVIDKPLNKKPVDDDDKTPVQERPLPDIPIQKQEVYVNETQMLLEDYDYVNLESKESVEREHKEIMESLPTELRKSYDNLIKQSHLAVDSDHSKALHKVENENLTHVSVNQSKTVVRLDANDRQVLNFYGVQSKLHLQNLNAAIDAFLLTVENNQPPKVFIAHSKFVILSAHKLVYIGDTIHRNVINTEVRTCVLNCTNALCDAMKNTVTSAKTAALQFPSVTAVQAMVDAFVSISHLSNNLKKAICRD